LLSALPPHLLHNLEVRLGVSLILWKLLLVFGDKVSLYRQTSLKFSVPLSLLSAGNARGKWIFSIFFFFLINGCLNGEAGTRTPKLWETPFFSGHCLPH
jgi:hypothetical protein